MKEFLETTIPDPKDAKQTIRSNQLEITGLSKADRATALKVLNGSQPSGNVSKQVNNNSNGKGLGLLKAPDGQSSVVQGDGVTRYYKHVCDHDQTVRTGCKLIEIDADGNEVVL